MDRSRIRNFSIIAHIDHGKSTLADRILEKTGALQAREMQSQFLDNLDLERERGITIKAQTVRLNYTAKDGITYEMHLIDTPGHVDFHYEVSRSMSACEGALLVVDASQGVEAQTLANVYVAIENNLEIVPVINKIDLPNADPETVRREIEEVVGIDASEAVPISAKTGIGILDVLEAVVKKIPPPTRGSPDNPLRALVYDSWFDEYQGVIVLIRVIDGVIRPGDKIRFLATGGEYEVYKVGVFTPHRKELEAIYSGQAGFVSATIRNLRDVRIGDTIALAGKKEVEPLPGFKEVKPAVFGGLFPVDSDDYQNLKAALEKLSLNDSSFTFEAETSTALGFGYRCGYLGLLHMEIIQERLEREFNLSLITTAPSVAYRLTLRNGNVLMVENPADFPSEGDIEIIEEPIVAATIHCPKEYVGGVLKLCEDKRGVQQSLSIHSQTRAMIVYDLPLSEIVLDFHDRLKSLSKGYASFDYEVKGYQPGDLVKLDIKLNGDPVDALAIVVHRENAFYKGRELCEKLKELIDRQMFEIAVQASIGSRIISRSTVKALRKNVTAKCYGGDISRKRKLLEKQKEGKKRMKQVGKVSISQDAFLAILKVSE